MSLIHAALAELGVRRLLLAIHDASFPSDPDEDLGRGSPATRAASRLFGFARGLGFTGLQLGPQGQTSRDNPSPYDGAMFSRHTGGIALGSFRPGGLFAGLVGEDVIDALGGMAPGRADHRRAYDATERLLDEAYAAFARGARPDLRSALAEFVGDHGPSWLAIDAQYATFARRFGGRAVRDWPPIVDPPPPAALERYAFAQLLVHAEHARVRAACGAAGLALYGDLQIGLADGDVWAHRSAFLADYVMGAPPSRTNPEGQPWGYALLDPAQLSPRGRALELFRRRIDKAFADYDGLRIDHPHGLVCPWVYRAGQPDPGAAVRAGARLYESPDLDDHPALAKFAIAEPAQLDRTLPRYHDAWVRELTGEQVARYARLFEVIAAEAARHGRDITDLSCEVLSTLPLPLARVLERYSLGRWRVLQKANLDDATDVYRAENAARADWVMLGNHDTAPIFAVVRGFAPALRARWQDHLARRLSIADASALAADGALATAMLAELFACAAENVSIFFADLFGYEERFNAPGTQSDENWSLRLPADFDDEYRDRVARGEALDLPRALALALDARGSTSGLAARLRAL